MNGAANGLTSFTGDDLSDGAIVAAQFDRYRAPARINNQAKELMFAVLEQALTTVANANMHGGYSRKTKFGYDQTERRQLRDIEQDRVWFADRQRWDLCSFNAIWTLLFPDFDIEKARREILEHPGQIRRRIKEIRKLKPKAEAVNE
jgi:hypothetical protein